MFKKQTMDISRIVPTSKLALKLSCLEACKNDITEAKKLYDYIASDLPSLPDVAPDSPSLLQKADSFLGWIGQHKDDFAQGISMIQSLRRPTSTAAAAAGVAAPVNPNL